MEVIGRDRDSQRVIGVLNGKGSDTHCRNAERVRFVGRVGEDKESVSLGFIARMKRLCIRVRRGEADLVYVLELRNHSSKNSQVETTLRLRYRNDRDVSRR